MQQMKTILKTVAAPITADTRFSLTPAGLAALEEAGRQDAEEVKAQREEMARAAAFFRQFPPAFSQDF